MEPEPQADLVSTQMKEAVDSAQAFLSSLPPQAGPEEDLISSFLKELEDIELEWDEASVPSSSSSTSGPIEEKDDLTSTLFKQLEAVEAAEEYNQSSILFEDLETLETSTVSCSSFWST